LPATPEAVGNFMRYCAVERARPLAASTVINGVKSAISHMHVQAGLPTPTTHPLVKETAAAVKRVGKTVSHAKKPLSTEMWAEMLRTSSYTVEDWRNLALLGLMTVAMLRQSEAIALRAEDLWVEELDEAGGRKRDVMFVLITKSKTDQERRGETVVVAASDNYNTCAVRVVRQWLLIRQQSSEYVFHKLNSDKPLKNQEPNAIMKREVERIGYDPKPYGSHSARKGGATAAVARGVEMHLLKRHGRWRSDAVYAYITDSLAARLSVSLNLLDK